MKNDAPQFLGTGLLPGDARAMLQRAAATPLNGDPMARKKAIDQAYKVIRRMYPAFFKPETADEIAIHEMLNKE